MIWQKLPPEAGPPLAGKKPIICLAPIDGYTDSAMRIICKEFGADLVFTEMISVDALVYAAGKIKPTLEFSTKEKPIIAQLFGKKPEHFAKAAKIIEKLEFDGIDINMGCPARHVFRHGSGASLLKDHKLAFEIVRAVVKSTKLPVSVKTRIGIDSSRGFLEFAKKLEKAGTSALTIHGRTYKQGFAGKVDWDLIAKAKKALKIPVIGNGGILDCKYAKKRLDESGVDGIMIARGAVGNPWIFQEIKEFLKTGNLPKPVSSEERFKVMLQHAKLAVKLKGEKRAMIELRKQLVNYVRGLPNASKVRDKLVQVESLRELEEIVS